MRRSYLLVAGAGLATIAGLTAYLAWPSRSPADSPRDSAGRIHPGRAEGNRSP